MAYLQRIPLTRRARGEPAEAQRQPDAQVRNPGSAVAGEPDARGTEVAVDLTTYMRMYEVTPHALRDVELRPKLRDMMRWYRTLDAWVYGSEHPDEKERAGLEPLSVLMAAVLNGIALQVQAEPDLDVQPAFDLWEQFVLEYLEKLQSR